jgi:siderophore synthetase component
LLYRDFGGVRVSPRALRRHGIDPPPLRGDIPTDDPADLETKVLASAVATVLAGLVTHLARRFHTEPAALWAAVPPHPRLRDRADLPLKATTAMRLADTVDDIWTTVPNPLAGR